MDTASAIKENERERVEPIRASVRTTEILPTWYYVLAVLQLAGPFHWS